MTRETKQILQAIPTDWTAVRYKDWRFLIETIPEELTRVTELDVNASIMNYFSGIPKKKIKQIPLEEFIFIERQLQALFQKQIPKDKIEIKALNKISYDDFVSLISIQQQNVYDASTLRVVLNAMTDKRYTDEEADNLPVSFVHGCFFLLLKKSKRYILLLTMKTIMKVMRFKTIKWMGSLTSIFKKRENK